MSKLHETLTRAVATSDLGMEAEVVHDVDRVAAMGLGAKGDLGSLVFRFARAEQPQWGRRIVLVLANRIIRRHAIGRQMAEKIAAVALLEFARPHCRSCGGARETMVGEVKQVCTACGGSGVERYTNAERRDLIGAYGKRVDDAMADCHRDLTNALAGFLGHVAGRLA
jgi:hypothetical protein